MAYYITEDCIGCTSCAKLCPTGAAQGEKKKHHQIVQEHCIECGTCGRICPKDAVEDPFGSRVKGEKKKFWKKPEFNLKTCSACGICVDACPVGCIIYGKASKKDKTAYPELISNDGCISCGFCVYECPVDAVTLVPPQDVAEEKNVA
ncbi:MAG: 4Fe-4S dicluster domain-containing protein [Proteobacteria bacterium]|nr:4Fe-4S dicluster domain-containing protein [Pseudomonadota bacterium]